jgi:hypothetical protein
MKKYLLSLSIVSVICSCSKNDGIDSKLVNITYEIESRTDKPFIDITYETADSAGNSKQKGDWTISGIGKFTKAAKIQRGFGAGLIVRNGYNGDWSLRILSNDGDTLAYSSQGGFYPGTLSYYGASIGVTVK